MKSLFVKIIAFSLAAALCLCLASCVDLDSLKVSDSDINTGFEPGTTFFRGVWAADDGNQRIGYYLFADEANGKYVDATNGTELAFNVSLEQKTALFHMNSFDEARRAEVSITDNGVRRLGWKNEDSNGGFESWSLIVGADPDTFTFFSAETLTGKARELFQTENGFFPESVNYMVDVFGNVLIELERDGKNKVKYSYEVNSITGKGKNITTCEAVDFSQ